MSHEEWKARIEKDAARYSDPKAVREAASLLRCQMREQRRQILQEELILYFDNFPLRDAIDMGIELCNWLSGFLTQECLDVLQDGTNGEDRAELITHYEEDITFVRERIRELENDRLVARGEE